MVGKNQSCKVWGPGCRQEVESSLRFSSTKSLLCIRGGVWSWLSWWRMHIFLMPSLLLWCVPKVSVTRGNNFRYLLSFWEAHNACKTFHNSQKMLLAKASWSKKPWMWNLATMPAWSDLIQSCNLMEKCCITSFILQFLKKLRIWRKFYKDKVYSP